MQYKKNLLIGFVGLALTAPVMASSTMANNTVFVPSQHGGFKIAVDPLYLRNSPGDNISNSNFDWGVFAQIGYLFPCTGNDITVDYTYLRSGDSDSNSNSMDLDTADLEIGQRLSTGAFDIHLFSGLRYAHLNSQLDVSTIGSQKSLTSLYHGFGPRLGADVRYQLGYSGFGFDTHLNSSFLVGKFNSKYQDELLTRYEGMNRVVPEIDAKLGIDYTAPLLGDGKSMFAIEVGYQMNNYVHALNSTFVTGSGDANLDGVYLDVKYYA